MNQPIKVSRKSVKPILDSTFPDYRGHKVRVQFAESVTLYDLNWSGGTRNQYASVRVDGRIGHVSNAAPPWDNPIEGLSVRIPVDTLIVQHSDFCGHDCGITIYAHPSLAPRFLPAGS